MVAFASKMVDPDSTQDSTLACEYFSSNFGDQLLRNQLCYQPRAQNKLQQGMINPRIMPVIRRNNRVIVRKKFSRIQLLRFSAIVQVDLIGMEAYAGSHFLGRALRE
jgi:hypothetical protein